MKNSIKQIMNEKRENRVDILKRIFSRKLKELREEKQLSQNAIAKKLGCAVSTYANWEQGRREPDIYDIYNILFVLEIEPNELFDVDEF